MSGGPDGGRNYGPAAITATSAITAETQIALISGAVTLTIPSGATAVIIIPPNAATPTPNPPYAGTITLKGITGDTGVAISNKWPTVLSWDTSPASLVLTATASGSALAWFL